tara:strand:+ start:318 stop:773 length:456 start_codon:yes stop_codon:yes gene_type:complete
MENVVKVILSKKGKVINPSANPLFGYIQLKQSTMSVDANGWVRPVNKYAILKGSILDLTALSYTAGKELVGTIQVIESHEPTNPEELEQDKKVAGETGIACTVAGRPIYRTSVYKTDDTLADVLIAHDNRDAIKSAQAELASSKETAGLED